MGINCPLCGTRPLEEFTCRGDATPTRPAEQAALQDWVDYVYVRDNPKGLHREHWRHHAGCGAWLNIERHTVTHEITQIDLAGKAGEGER